MRDISLDPARSLLNHLTIEELERLARRLKLKPSTKKASLIAELVTRLGTDEIVELLLASFPRQRLAAAEKTATTSVTRTTEPPDDPSQRVSREPDDTPQASPLTERLDRSSRRHGETTVQVYARTDPGLGRLLLESDNRCRQLRIPAVQLFLENRWPVVAIDIGTVPSARLYAGFTARGRVHRSAEMPPPRDKPFILDEGEYGVRNGRLRFEFKRSGPLSFKVRFMRWSPRTGRPEYLLLPIA